MRGSKQIRLDAKRGEAYCRLRFPNLIMEIPLVVQLFVDYKVQGGEGHFKLFGNIGIYALDYLSGERDWSSLCYLLEPSPGEIKTSYKPRLSGSFYREINNFKGEGEAFFQPGSFYDRLAEEVKERYSFSNKFDYLFSRIR